MKELKAIIRNHRLQAVLDELREHPSLPGVTISNVRGFGKIVGRHDATGPDPTYYGTVGMTKVECVVNDELLDEIVLVIQKAGYTGSPGDGKIVIYDVNDMVRIRTGERGKGAI